MRYNNFTQRILRATGDGDSGGSSGSSGGSGGGYLTVIAMIQILFGIVKLIAG